MKNELLIPISRLIETDFLIDERKYSFRYTFCISNALN